MPPYAEFFNASLCISGKFEHQTLLVDLSTGLIAENPQTTPDQDVATSADKADAVTESYDLRGHVIAPAYIDIQANGAGGFSFDPSRSIQVEEALDTSYPNGLKRAAKSILASGTGSFLATLPTLSEDAYRRILPELQPQTFAHGAELLGVHCEGPWLSPAQKSNHDSSLMQWPAKASAETVYGASNLKTIKMVTLAPELPGAMDMVSCLHHFHHYTVGLGHSTSGVDMARFAYHCGGLCMTHLFHAMASPTNQDPGFMGWAASGAEPYFTVVADGYTTHQYLVSTAFRINPRRCILVTDSSPMAGMPDGQYQALDKPTFNLEEKRGDMVLHATTKEVLGSCVGLDECVRNLMKFARCTLAEAVMCVTENVASLLELSDRGRLKAGCRADFVILNEAGFVVEVWQAGRCTFRPGMA